MKKILICEDEESIRSFLVVCLRRAGYTVVEAASGEEALSRYDADPTITMALLDGMLPGIDGFEVCRRLRRRDSRMGIIMLTALTREEEKVGGLQSGADDYVTKPFSTAELVARVDALHRRLQLPTTDGEDAARMHSGDYVLDRNANTLQWDGETVELTQLECLLMTYFLKNPGRLITRSELLESVWRSEEYAEEKIVDVNIRRLRMKVERDPSNPKHLQTVWGQGYQWKP